MAPQRGQQPRLIFRRAPRRPALPARRANSGVSGRVGCKNSGLRHPAITNLAWYETLLVARVHPVISVVRLLATGQLCYAGHVCNYFVKTFEWFQEPPNLLRE